MSVSVVIPTYKRVEALNNLLESIYNQTYREYEVIVVDDNSPNWQENDELVRSFSDRGLEIKLLKNECNRGAPHSRNRGILESKYNLVALVDDDDEWRPEKLEKQVWLFNAASDRVGLIYTWTDVHDERGSVVYSYREEIEGIALKEILKECFIPSPSVMVRKEAIIEAGLFDESLPSCQDWDMWTRILSLGYECRVVKSALTIYNKHSGESIGSSNRARQGYRMYYRKHLLKSIKNGVFVNIKKLLGFLIIR